MFLSKNEILRSARDNLGGSFSYGWRENAVDGVSVELAMLAWDWLGELAFSEDECTLGGEPAIGCVSA